MIEKKFLKRIFFLFLLFLTLLTNLFFLNESANAACSIFRYRDCLRPKLGGCCKKKHGHCKCIKVKVWLPTAVALSVVETNLAATNLNFSQLVEKGNVKIIRFNCKNVAKAAYGLKLCKFGCKPKAPIVDEISTLLIDDWKNSDDYEILKLSVVEDEEEIPQLLMTRVEDYAFSSTLDYLLRAIKFEGKEPEWFRVGASPYAKECFSLEKNYQIVTIFEDEIDSVYSDFGRFLNRFEKQTFDKFDHSLFDKFYDQSCSDRVKSFEVNSARHGKKKFPVYFIFEKKELCVKISSIKDMIKGLDRASSITEKRLDQTAIQEQIESKFENEIEKQEASFIEKEKEVQEKAESEFEKEIKEKQEKLELDTTSNNEIIIEDTARNFLECPKIILSGSSSNVRNDLSADLEMIKNFEYRDFYGSVRNYQAKDVSEVCLDDDSVTVRERILSRLSEYEDSTQVETVNERSAYAFSISPFSDVTKLKIYRTSSDRDLFLMLEKSDSRFCSYFHSFDVLKLKRFDFFLNQNLKDNHELEPIQEINCEDSNLKLIKFNQPIEITISTNNQNCVYGLILNRNFDPELFMLKVEPSDSETEETRILSTSNVKNIKKLDRLQEFRLSANEEKNFYFRAQNFRIDLQTLSKYSFFNARLLVVDLGRFCEKPIPDRSFLESLIRLFEEGKIPSRSEVKNEFYDRILWNVSTTLTKSVVVNDLDAESCFLVKIYNDSEIDYDYATLGLTRY